MDIQELRKAINSLALELCEKAGLEPGQYVVVGCSTSEISGYDIGTQTSIEIGDIVFDELYNVFSSKDINIAAQCCEHLNRAIIINREKNCDYQIVNAVPTPQAGGTFAAAAYRNLKDPIALESFKAHAGLDIGGTLIGMHLKHVAVPLRLNCKKIGKAIIIAARTRPPLIGGNRTTCDNNIM
ncbi:MAG: TIGR01440 family protein [Oscillospiraceae bacterium]|nr:TIGR01440 family protein [Oscillospiraceae bacterium]